MKKEDLETGMYVITRNGDVHIVATYIDKLIDIHSGQYLTLDGYNDNFEDCCDDNHDIIRIYDNCTLNNLLWERKELPELSELDIKQLEVLKELGYARVKRDIHNDIWLFKDDESVDVTYLFKNIFKTLKENEKYSIKELLGE